MLHGSVVALPIGEYLLISGFLFVFGGILFISVYRAFAFQEPVYVEIRRIRKERGEWRRKHAEAMTELEDAHQDLERAHDEIHSLITDPNYFRKRAALDQRVVRETELSLQRVDARV